MDIYYYSLQTIILYTLQIGFLFLYILGTPSSHWRSLLLLLRLLFFVRMLPIVSQNSRRPDHLSFLYILLLQKIYLYVGV